MLPFLDTDQSSSHFYQDPQMSILIAKAEQPDDERLPAGGIRDCGRGRSKLKVFSHTTMDTLGHTEL